MAERFGPFELHKLYGRGGMGEVFLASRAGDPEETRVVLKRMRPEVASDEEQRRRLTFEAQVASRLKHPNLVKLLEYGRVGQCPYIVMEHLRGHSLKRLLAPAMAENRPPSLPAALGVGVDLLSALSVMHGARDHDGAPRPILHRDVKPENVIITHGGKPVLIDFGIAKDVMGPAITLYGKVVGTARYMAPENRLGGLLDPRADVFSLSLILFELISARQPWPPLSTRKELLRIVFDPPEITSQIAERIPQDVLPIVIKGLACDAADRWSDAGEMLEALRATETYRRLAPDGGSLWGEISRWVESTGLTPDEALEHLVIDHRAAHEGGEELTWSPDGQLLKISGHAEVRAGDLPPAEVLTIPPLAPRRDQSIQPLEIPDLADDDPSELGGRFKWLVASGIAVLLAAAAAFGFYLTHGAH